MNESRSSKRRYKPQEPVAAPTDWDIHLPTDCPIAVYYRQSSDSQVGNVSTTIQTVDMVAYLKQRGWGDDDIIMIDMDAGISGTTKIDERPGMRKLFDLITQGQIGTVACQDEDRLFRDVTQIQVNIFIEACRTSHVLVLTPSMVYDFGNELAGTFHARQFRFKSEMAAEYLQTVIKGKLHRARNRVLREGRWAGGNSVPLGFMVDIRKTLPDGSKNENWRRYAPFEPYAEVIREYFRLFWEYGGSLQATLRHIHAHGPYYPEPGTYQTPEGFRVFYRMRQYGYGYCPGRTGLRELLTNAVYIGHWSHVGSIVRWNNHPPIISEQVFFAAYNYLCEVTLDGQPNPDYRPFYDHARPSKEADRPVERPLCVGLLFSYIDGKWQRVGAHWTQAMQRYAYVATNTGPLTRFDWSKKADFVDDAIVDLLRDRLTETFKPEKWQAYLDTFTQTYEQERHRKQAQIAALEKVMQNQVASLDVLSDPNMIRDAELRYKDAQAEYKRLTTEYSATGDQLHRLEILSALKDHCGAALEDWPKLTRDEKRLILFGFISHIEATAVERGGIHLRIYWHDNETSEMTLIRQQTCGQAWSHKDVQRLTALMDAKASQIEIAAAFPNRTWEVIRWKAVWLRGKGVLRVSPKLIREKETYPQYLERTQGKTEPYRAGSGDKWTPAQVEKLLALADAGAIQVEFLRTFPYRMWGRIRAKLIKVRGSDMGYPVNGEVLRDETLAMYEERKRRETEDDDPTDRSGGSPISTQDQPNSDHIEIGVNTENIGGITAEASLTSDELLRLIWWASSLPASLAPWQRAYWLTHLAQTMCARSSWAWVSLASCR
jgi:DNA invertase Pin-like site-specific DNA recombinase